jgi:hypothetical protein
MNELITVRNTETGHIGRCTERDLSYLGSKYVVVKDRPQVLKPDEKPIPKPDNADTVCTKELTKDQLVEALKGFGLKGLHLYSLEKLRETYESKIH